MRITNSAHMLTPDKKDVALRASLSDVCNFDCLYCVKDLGMENHTPREIDALPLTADEYIENMRKIARHGISVISFTGGEPLLNPAFPAILRGVRSLFERIEITTNGTNLPRYLPELEQNVDVLKISCDAFDPSVRLAISRNSASVDTLDIIEQCAASKLKKIGINLVLMRKNCGEFSELAHFVALLNKKYGRDIYISLLDLYYSDGNRDFWTNEFLSFSAFRKRLEEQGITVSPLNRTGCEFYTFTYHGVKVNMKDSYSSTYRAAQCKDCGMFCQEGIYSMKHSVSGWVSICPTNARSKGFLLNGRLSDDEAAARLNSMIDIINSSVRERNTSFIFEQTHSLNHPADRPLAGSL